MRPVTLVVGREDTGRGIGGIMGAVGGSFDFVFSLKSSSVTVKIESEVMVCVSFGLNSCMRFMDSLRVTLGSMNGNAICDLAFSIAFSSAATSASSTFGFANFRVGEDPR